MRKTSATPRFRTAKHRFSSPHAHANLNAFKLAAAEHAHAPLPCGMPRSVLVVLTQESQADILHAACKGRPRRDAFGRMRKG
jgi:hypothetical protein